MNLIAIFVEKLPILSNVTSAFLLCSALLVPLAAKSQDSQREVWLSCAKTDVTYASDRDWLEVAKELKDVWMITGKRFYSYDPEDKTLEDNSRETTWKDSEIIYEYNHGDNGRVLVIINRSNLNYYHRFRPGRSSAGYDAKGICRIIEPPEVRKNLF